MTKPTSYPRWATVAPGTSREEPDEVHKDDGWADDEQPPGKWFNWQQGLAGDWCKWLYEVGFDPAAINVQTLVADSWDQVVPTGYEKPVGFLNKTFSAGAMWGGDWDETGVGCSTASSNQLEFSYACPYSNNDTIRLTADSVFPTGLYSTHIYWVINVSGRFCQIAEYYGGAAVTYSLGYNLHAHKVNTHLIAPRDGVYVPTAQVQATQPGAGTGVLFLHMYVDYTEAGSSIVAAATQVMVQNYAMKCLIGGRPLYLNAAQSVRVLASYGGAAMSINACEFGMYQIANVSI